MVSIHTVVGIMACGFLLCLGLSNGAQAESAPAFSDHMKTNAQSGDAKKIMGAATPFPLGVVDSVG